MKLVPQLNSAGFFVSMVEADASPLEVGVWIIPGGALDAAAPRALGLYECARYSQAAGAWSYLPDYSGAAVYSVATAKRIDVAQGLSLLEVGGTLQAPDAPATQPEAATAEDLKAELLRAAAARRWAIESGGLMVGGAFVATAIEDQNRITSVIVNAAHAGLTAVDFKAVSGWVTVTTAELAGIASAVAKHVQRCYSAERAHHEAIAQLQDIKALRAYDLSAGWPTNNTEPAAE